MISATYGLSGLLLAVAGYFFAIGILSATGQTVAWMVIFFFASAAASSAYLTVSETFPLEVRALAIAFFYAIGTGIGGVAGPWLFGALIDTGSRWSVYGGYILGSALMIAAAVIHARFCVAAERKPLEAVAKAAGCCGLTVGIPLPLRRRAPPRQSPRRRESAEANMPCSPSGDIAPSNAYLGPSRRVPRGDAG